MKRIAYLVLTSTLALGACSDDPVSYSAPVGINLKAKASDVAANAITEQKAITTESGNPYGAFINDATAKLGHAPGRAEVDHVTLLLGGTSQGVARLEDVFTGSVDVAFVLDDTNNTYDVGTIGNPTGVGPDGLDVTFEASALAPQDVIKYLGGGFKVALRGTAAAAFTGGEEADLQVTLTFAAFP